MIEVLLLAIALSMDAFAVSIALGANQNPRPLLLAVTAGLYFGIFHAIMPFIGYWGGSQVFSWLEALSSWIAFLLLFIIGCKMIYESLSETSSEQSPLDSLTHKTFLVLAIATSIDALAAGFSLNLLTNSPIIACLIFGVTIFISSVLGVFIGAKGARWLGAKAGLLGGVILVLIGFRVLFI